VIDMGAGRFYLWGERALYLGPGLPASVHAHHAIQVCIPLSGTIRLRTEPGAPWRRYAGAIIPSNQAHESDIAVPLLATLWMEPQTSDARRLVPPDAGFPIVAIERAKIARIVPRLLECWHARCEPPKTSAVMQEVIGILAAGRSPRAPVEPRVARALEILDSADQHRVGLGEVASAVSLSPSRLAHLFRADMGMPVRRYLLWRKLRDAIEELAKGAAISEAAYAADFADAPHLDRTFRRMLGFTPSAALRRQGSRFVQDTVANRG